MTRALAGALVCALAATSLPARASPLFELTGAGFGSGGLNARGTGASAASTYFNPALLPKAKQGLELGWLTLHDGIRVGLDGRPAGVDVPLSAVERVRTGRAPVPTAWLEQGCSPAEGGSCVRDVSAAPRRGRDDGQVHGYQLLGLVNHLLDERLALGLYAMVPLSSFTQANSFFVDEREQFFSNRLHPELYEDRLTPVSLAFGAGGQLTRSLSIGLSFTLGLSNAAAAQAYVGNSRLLDETLELSTRVDVKTSVSPHLGVHYTPSARLDLSFTLHTPQKTVIDTEFGIYLPNGDVQRAHRKATHAYLPFTAGLAASYALTSTFALAATATFERWSRYLNRQDERPGGAYAWRDIATGALGVRYARGALAGYADASFRPSPVPRQTGRTNYVDNHRVSFLVGASYELPLPRFADALRFGAQAQVHVLPARHQRKLDPSGASRVPRDQRVLDEWPDDTTDVSTGQVIGDARGLQTNNPGYPGFGSRGFLLGGTLSVALLY